LALVLLVLLSAPDPGLAAIYRWVDGDGVINYSDNVYRFEAHQRHVNPQQVGPAADSKPQGSSLPAEAPDVPKLLEGTSPARLESVTVEVMRLSGIDVQVAQVAAIIQGEFERWISFGVQPPPGAASLVAQRFNADMLRGNMHQSLTRDLGQPQAAILLSWLRSPLSQRIVALEGASSTADGLAGLAGFINQLPSAPPAPTRLALIHRLERAGEVTDSSATVAVAAVAALRRIMAPLVPPSLLGRLGLDEQTAGPAIDEGYRLRIMTSLLFTYRDLSDAELARYVTVLESPTGRWFTQVVRTAFLASLETPEHRRNPGIATVGNKKTR
jgi:hypothetical protein